MKALIVFFIALLCQIPVPAQTLPEWLRVYTFDDKSTIELNTDYVMFSNDNSSRVRFRWNFAEPQNLNGEKKLAYKSFISEYQFDCEQRLFRNYTSEFFDVRGKSLRTESYYQTADWSSVSDGKIIQSLFAPACRLINLRKREPATER